MSCRVHCNTPSISILNSILKDSTYSYAKLILLLFYTQDLLMNRRRQKVIYMHRTMKNLLHDLQHLDVNKKGSVMCQLLIYSVVYYKNRYMLALPGLRWSLRKGTRLYSFSRSSQSRSGIVRFAIVPKHSITNSSSPSSLIWAARSPT